MKAGLAAALSPAARRPRRPRGRRRGRRGGRRGAREPRRPGGRYAPLRADAAVVTEPTELEVVVAHKGFVWSRIEVAGRAAHGSRPAPRGRRDRPHAGPVLIALGALDDALGDRTHPLLGRGSVHASRDRGRRGALQLPGAMRARRSSAGRCRGRPRPASRPSWRRSWRAARRGSGARGDVEHARSCASRSRWISGGPEVVGAVARCYWADAALSLRRSRPAVRPARAPTRRRSGCRSPTPRSSAARSSPPAARLCA